LVAEYQTFYRRGLRELINGDGMQVVAEAGDGQTAVRLTSALRPHVVLMGCSLAGLDPIEVTRELTRSGTGTPVVLLSESADSAVPSRASFTSRRLSRGGSPNGSAAMGSCGRPRMLWTAR
jgi:response regulator NasT